MLSHLHVNKISKCVALTVVSKQRWRRGTHVSARDILNTFWVTARVRYDVVDHNQLCLRTCRGPELLQDLHAELIGPIMQYESKQEYRWLRNFLLPKEIMS